MSAPANVGAAERLPRRRGAVWPFPRWRAARRPLFAYLARFAGFSAAFYAMSFAPLWEQILQRYLSATAALASSGLNLLHQHTQHASARVFSAHFALTVAPKCSAAELIAFFWAAVLAFPAPPRRKALALALGTALLTLLNVGRIMTVFLVGASHPQLSEMVHEELCPALLQVATLVLALSWIWWVTRHLPEAPAPSLTVSIGRLVLIFALLLVPCLRLTEFGGEAFRSVGALAFTSVEGEREVTFESSGPRHTTAAIVNRTQMNPDGSGPVRNLDLDTFAYLWRPTLLVLALSLATRIPFRRRLQAAGLATLCLWAYAWAALSFAIWNESTEVALVTLSPFWKGVANEAQATLIAQLGVTVPALVWLVCIFPPVNITARASPGQGREDSTRAV